MDRGTGQIKYVTSLIFPDCPVRLKLGRLSLASVSREGKYLGKKRIQHIEIFKGELWKGTTAEKRWEVKHRQPKS